MPRWKIGKLEADDLGGLRLDEVERCLAALGAELEIRVRYRGAAVDRVLDEVHAGIVARVVEVLGSLGWVTRIEVSFNEWGERGSYDILAWHPIALVLLVVEVKSELGSIEGTLRPLSVKVRLARKVARDAFGWQARSVGRALVLPESRTSRRAVERHDAILRSELPATSRQLHSWLRSPKGALGAIWFLSAPAGKSWERNPSSISRVRSVRTGRDPAFVSAGQH